jgi:cell division protease FtsH
VIFGRVTTGAANDLEKVTGLARSMVFEYGMGEINATRTMRADNYALSEETKRQRDLEQTLLTERAYADAIRILTKHRALLDRVANALLEHETLTRKELLEIFGDVQPESRASEAVGVVRAVGADATA